MRILLAGLGLTVLFALPPSTGAQEVFRIGLIGDQTGVDLGSGPTDLRRNLTKSYHQLEAGAALLSGLHLNAALHMGDLLEDSLANNELEYDAAFERASAILDHLNVPWFVTPGDHDVNPPKDKTPDSKCNSYVKYLATLYAKRFPVDGKHLYYSFDLKGFHFIALDSLENLRADPRWGDVFLSQVSSDQYKWLEIDLANHRNSKGIVIFTHQPLWYNWTGWSRIHALLRSYAVRAVVAGHFHYSQDEGELDGIRYVVVGATGADTKKGNINAGDVQQVMIMTLSEGRPASFQSLSLPDGKPIAIPSRRDMDRVQALDLMLDNNYQQNGGGLFGVCTPLCLINGQPYADERKTPPVLKLCGLGNPIDVDIHISLESASDWTLIAPKFLEGTGGCTPPSSAQSCVLPPSSGIALSNNSLVESRNQPPLWEAGLRAGHNNPEDLVELRMRVNFKGEQETDYMLERKLTAKVFTKCSNLPACPSPAWNQCAGK